MIDVPKKGEVITTLQRAANELAPAISDALLSIKRSATQCAPLIPVAFAALLSTKAEAAWPTGIDVDNNIDGIAAGTNINDGSFIYSFCGRPDGLSFREIDDGAGGSTILTSTDGVTSTDITADIEALDSTLSGSIIEVSGYDETTDKLMIWDYSNLTYWVVSNASDTSLMSATELNSYGFSIGSIDKFTGEYIGAYDYGTSADSDPASYTSGSTPSVIYTRTGSDFQPQSDLANDRVFITDSSANIYLVTNLSTTPVRTAWLSTGDSGLAQFTGADSSRSGYDEVFYVNSAGELSYGYDDASGVTVPVDTDGDTILDSVDVCPAEDATGWDADADGCIDDTDSDGVKDDLDDCASTTDISTVDAYGCSDAQRDSDGDGSMADVDCDDSNATMYPSNVISYGDGADNDCLDSNPEITSMSISPATVEVGVRATLSASSRDDETASPNITWEVRDSGGNLVDTSSGSSSSFSTTVAGTYTITAIATDGDGNTTSSSDTLVVTEEPVTYQELPESGDLTNGTTYYEDPANPSSGYLAVGSNGVSIAEDGTIELTSPSSISFSGMQLVIEGQSERFSAVATVYTYDNMEGSALMGVLAFNGGFSFTDTSDPASILTINLNVGRFDGVGIYDDLYDDPTTEGDNEFFGFQTDVPGSYTISDTKDDEEEGVDTAEDTDPQTDSDTDPDPDDSAEETDTDPNPGSDSAGGDDSEHSVGDTGGNAEDCGGCATEDGANGTWALGVLAIAALRRRREEV